MPSDRKSVQSNRGDATTKSQTKVEQNSKYVNVKNIVLKHLAKYKTELKNESIEFEPITLGVRSSEIEPIAAVELKKKPGSEADTPELQRQREAVVGLVQGLVEGIQTDGERVVVVNVNTPAVDLDKTFTDDQLSFMRKDIFSSIEQQLGLEFHQDVETQWGDAFAAMMDIVDNHKRKTH